MRVKPGSVSVSLETALAGLGVTGFLAVKKEIKVSGIEDSGVLNSGTEKLHIKMAHANDVAFCQ